MLKVRGIKVHDDTHRVLKKLKSQMRAKSLDEIIRGMVKKSTGRSVEQHLVTEKNLKITTYLQNEGAKQK
jgi:predicted CopG family antitoxin